MLFKFGAVHRETQNDKSVCCFSDSFLPVAYSSIRLAPQGIRAGYNLPFIETNHMSKASISETRLFVSAGAASRGAPIARCVEIK
jgi:hypothetical protein